MICSSLLILLTLASTSAWSAPYSKAQRQDYVTSALRAVRSAPKQALENLYQYVNVVEQTSCRSAYEGMALACLMEQVKANCRTIDASSRANCPVLSDLIVVNKLNEKIFVTRDERLEMMQKSSGGSYATTYSKLILRKYALLSTELLLLGRRTCSNDEFACMARELDDYCIKNSDVKSIPWQACISGIVWFIGLSR